jgi:hypothetical protein
MDQAYLYEVPAHWLALATFFLVFIFNVLGFRYRKWIVRKDPSRASKGLGPIESSLLGLMALILSFTFGMASSKFEARRSLIIEEANDIGTAILRCDLYPDSVRSALRQDFREYVNARIAYYDAIVDKQKIQAALDRANHYSYRIWKRAAEYSQIPEQRSISILAMPSLNAMIDIVSTRDAARLAKVPPVILFVLVVLVLISAFLVGYGQSGERNIVLVTGFALMTTIALYMIIELDRPRRGILTLRNEEQRIVELREMLVD